MARLLQKYNDEIKAKLSAELACKNPKAIPRLEKVVVSLGVGAGVWAFSEGRAGGVPVVAVWKETGVIVPLKPLSRWIQRA